MDRDDKKILFGIGLVFFVGSAVSFIAMVSYKHALEREMLRKEFLVDVIVNGFFLGYPLLLVTVPYAISESFDRLLSFIRFIRLNRSIRWGRKYKEYQGDLCNSCHVNKKLSEEFPYCRNCAEDLLKKTQTLVDETKARIRLANELGFLKQAAGAKKWFWENLPRPVKDLIEKRPLTLHILKEYFPETKPFDPSFGRFDKFPLNSGNAEVNLPGKALKMIVRFREDLVVAEIMKGGRRNA